MSVTIDDQGAITILTVNRPEAHNAVNNATAHELAEAIETFNENDASRVLVLTGAGDKAFCAGADLKDIAPMLNDSEFCDSVGPMGFAKLQARKPTIAAIEGYCFAGGLELAGWCDFRIAGSTAEFGALNRRWGVPFFDGGTQRLPRIVGLSNALWLMETGIRIDAQRACEIGYVQEIVEPRTALDRAIHLAEHMAQYPQESLVGDRQTVLDYSEHALQEGLYEEDEGRRQSLQNSEMFDRLADFASGDRPMPPMPEDS